MLFLNDLHLRVEEYIEFIEKSSKAKHLSIAKYTCEDIAKFCKVSTDTIINLSTSDSYSLVYSVADFLFSRYQDYYFDRFNSILSLLNKNGIDISYLILDELEKFSVDLDLEEKHMKFTY